MAFHTDFILRRHLCCSYLAGLHIHASVGVLRFRSEYDLASGYVERDAGEPGRTCRSIGHVHLSIVPTAISSSATPAECFQGIVIASSRGSGIIQTGYMWGYFPGSSVERSEAAVAIAEPYKRFSSRTRASASVR